MLPQPYYSTFLPSIYNSFTITTGLIFECNAGSSVVKYKKTNYPTMHILKKINLLMKSNQHRNPSKMRVRESGNYYHGIANNTYVQFVAKMRESDTSC